MEETAVFILAPLDPGKIVGHRQRQEDELDEVSRPGGLIPLPTS